MKNPSTAIPTSLSVLRWTARILGAASLGTLGLFMVGEGFNPFHLAWREAVLSVFFPLGVMAGLVVAWWREGTGGTLAIAGLIGFYLGHALLVGSFPSGWAFAVVSAPGAVFLLFGALKWVRDAQRASPTSPSRQSSPG